MTETPAAFVSMVAPRGSPMRWLAFTVAASLCIAGSPVAAVLMSVTEEMRVLVEPASNTVFALAGEVDPIDGPGLKVSQEQWERALLATQVLKNAASNLNGPQKQIGAIWIKSAADFARLADEAEKAAGKEDAAAFAKAANDLGDTCTSCHNRHKRQK
jgi:cytochrome c556